MGTETIDHREPTPNEEAVFAELPVTGEDVQKRTAELATQIAKDYKESGMDKNLLIVSITKGGLFFTIDLGRALDDEGIKNIPLELIDASSYVGHASGDLDVKRGFDDFDVKGADVLIVDDIVDTGKTLSEIHRMAEESGANSVRSAVLANKPTERTVPYEPNYYGFNLPAKWVFGNGMDDGTRDNGRFARGIEVYIPPQENVLVPEDKAI